MNRLMRTLFEDFSHLMATAHPLAVSFGMAGPYAAGQGQAALVCLGGGSALSPDAGVGVLTAISVEASPLEDTIAGPATIRPADEQGLCLILKTGAGGDSYGERCPVRFLDYANEFAIEGLIANRPIARDHENRVVEPSVNQRIESTQRRPRPGSTGYVDAVGRDRQ